MFNFFKKRKAQKEQLKEEEKQLNENSVEEITEEEAIEENGAEYVDEAAIEGSPYVSEETHLDETVSQDREEEVSFTETVTETVEKEDNSAELKSDMTAKESTYDDVENLQEEEVPVEEEDSVAEEIPENGDTMEEEPVIEKPAAKEKGFFSRLKAGLSKTRESISKSFDQLFKGFSTIDDDFYEELEETLIMADLGLDTTDRIIEQLKTLVKKNHIKEVEACRELVINIIKEQMLVDDSAYDFEDKKTVMLIIGVNGVGKTTSIGKLAAQYKKRGKRVMMCAADTFRAAAIDQLKTWANRAGVEIISQQEGSDPAAVTFDAVKAAASRNVDILLVDTAGRLHNKKNLMDELAKMKRIIEKEYSDAHLET